MTQYMREALKEQYRENVLIAAELVYNTSASFLDVAEDMGYCGSDLDDFMQEVLDCFVDLDEKLIESFWERLRNEKHDD